MDLRFLVGQDIRDRFSGAVEAFARRNNAVSGLHGDSSSKDLYRQGDSERGRSSGNGSTSKRAVVSSGSYGEASGRISTTHSSTQPGGGFDPKTSALARGSDALRSFEFLSIGSTKRK